MNKTQKNTFNKDEVITVDNIRNIGEWAAAQVVKSNLARQGGCPFLQKLYGGIIRDIHNLDTPGYALSEAYDIVQEAMTFLCGHLERKLNDTVTDRKGEQVSIYIACFRVINGYVQREQRKTRKSPYIEDLAFSMFSVPFAYNPEAEDYAAADKIVAAMNLTERQAEALSCRISGLSMKGTARALSVTIKPVYQLMYKIRAKFLQTFGDTAAYLPAR